MTEKGDNGTESLNEFIGQNINLIVALGVFSALTVYFNNNIPKASVTSFILTLLIGIELWTNTPDDDESEVILYFFKYILLVLLIFIGYFLFLGEGTQNKWFRYFIGLGIGSSILQIIRKTNHYTKFLSWYSNKEKRFKKIFKYTLIILGIVSFNIVEQYIKIIILDEKLAEVILGFFMVYVIWPIYFERL